MNIITVNAENIAREHICCAIGGKDGQEASKKRWLTGRFGEGLTFKKCDVRGKCFIEYIPAEAAWAPVSAKGYMYIDCFWIAGQFKGQGYGNLLLDECIRDSRERGYCGLVALSSAKKRAFLSDGDYLRHRGFVTADEAAPFYQLLYLPFDESAEIPRFNDGAKTAHINESGIVLYYSDQCPYTAKYVPLIVAQAEKLGVPLKTVHLESAADAQASPAVFTTYTMFYNGEFVTHEIMSEAKFAKFVSQTRAG